MSEDDKWLHKALTGKIIGAALEVRRILGSGFLEYVYEEAFCHELKLRGIHFERQKPLDIICKDILIPRKYTPDLLIEEKVIVGLKATPALTEIDEAQLINYIKGAKKDLAFSLTSELRA